MKSNEERMEPMMMLGRGLLHELNNMIAPVVAYPSLLIDEITDPDHLMMLGEIERGAKASSDLIRDLQSLLRCGSTDQAETFDLRGLLEDFSAVKPFSECERITRTQVF